MPAPESAKPPALEKGGVVPAPVPSIVLEPAELTPAERIRQGQIKGREMKALNRAKRLAKEAAREVAKDPEGAAKKAARSELARQTRAKQNAACAADPALEALRVEKARQALKDATAARQAGFERWKQEQALKKVGEAEAEAKAVVARREKRKAEHEKKKAERAAKEAAKPPPPPPKPKIPFLAQSGFVEKYGYKVPVGTPVLALELNAYRDNITPEMGGLGAEQHFKKAFRIMWPSYEWNDWVEMIVSAFCRYRYISIIGHQRASKTFTNAHVAWLDYCANPFNTLTSLSTVTFEGLKLRMWSDLMLAGETAAVKQPFTIRNTTNELRVYPTEVSRESGEKYQIKGMALDRGQDAVGRVKGSHAPRVRLFIDEAENVPAVIYDALDNPMSAPDAKAVMLFNPLLWTSPAGKLCLPKNGLGSIRDTDLYWETKLGICLHLDGLQSPNIIQHKKVFTGLLTQFDVDAVRTKSGENSVAWWSRVRGFPPPDGMVSQIFPSQIIEKGKPAIIFDFAPEPCCTLDPAFDADNCVLHFGMKGKLRDGRTAISGTKTHVVQFKVGGDAELRDFQVRDTVITQCKAGGIKPANFIMDRSGSGRGVFAMIHKDWSAEIHGVDYGGEATERPIRSDENDRCCDVYEKFVTELWMRARECIADGILGGLSNLNELTIEDLSSRLYETKEVTKGTVIVAETKREMKKRLGRSPDFGDAFVQFGELLIRDGHGPGREKKPLAGSRWKQHRQRAIAAGKRYAEAAEFSHH